MSAVAQIDLADRFARVLPLIATDIGGDIYQQPGRLIIPGHEADEKIAGWIKFQQPGRLIIPGPIRTAALASLKSFNSLGG